MTSEKEIVGRRGRMRAERGAVFGVEFSVFKLEAGSHKRVYPLGRSVPTMHHRNLFYE